MPKHGLISKEVEELANLRLEEGRDNSLKPPQEVLERCGHLGISPKAPEPSAVSRGLIE